MKIAKHICFFFQEARIQYINRMAEEASKYPHATDIFVHTNQIFPLTQIYANVSVNIILHDLNGKDPYTLPWLCRELMEKQADLYDIFIYVEDDILIPAEAIQYWLSRHTRLKSYNLNLGFVRIEVDSTGEEFLSDFHNEHCLPAQITQVLKIEEDVFAVNNVNTYTAFWIYDKEDFAKFISSKFWKLSDSLYGYDIRAAAAIGLHGIRESNPDNNSYLHTVIPIDISSGQFVKDCRVYHMPNNYVNEPFNFFATVRYDEGIAWTANHCVDPGRVLERKRLRLSLANH